MLSVIFSRTPPQGRAARRAYLIVEQLEDRTVPAQLMWTDATGSGLWNNPDNWRDLLGGPSAVPGPADYVLFGSGGADTPCTVDLPSVTVDRIIMDSGYNSILTIPGDAVLSTTNYFTQYGTLSILGGSTSGTAVIVGDYMNVNGAITASGSGAVSSLLSVQGSFFINASGSITVTGNGGPVSDLTISSGGMDDGGTINVGDAILSSAGTLAIMGPFQQLPFAVTNIASAGGASTLKFIANGSSTHPTIQGTINLDGTITTDTQLDISAGTLNSLSLTSGGDVIDGGVSVLNGGSVNIGDPIVSAPATLNLTGSLTVGARSPDLSTSTGTVNLFAGSVLNFFPGASSTGFVIKSQGVVNLYDGAQITLDPGVVLDIRPSEPNMPELPPGQLNSFDTTTLGNVISGSVFNNGAVAFAGAFLNSLTITGDYTQGIKGTLYMRLDNGALNDTLAVFGTASLGGTLSLGALQPLQPLDPGQTWAILAAGTIVADFAAVFFPPDGNPNWVWVVALGTVSN